MADETLRLDPSWTRVAETAFVARGAVVIGHVTLADEASVWFGCVLRGDTELLEVGPRTNVQDGVVLHADPGMPTRLGSGVTVGHRAIVHGATVGDGSLVGMGAILLDGAVVGPRCLVGAGSLLPAGKRYEEPGMLLLGSPARPVRPLRHEELADLQASADRYVAKARAMRAAGLSDPRFP